MSMTWSGVAHRRKAVCTSGNEFAALTVPVTTDGLNLSGAEDPAYGGATEYDVNIESHDGATLLTGGSLRCYVKNEPTGNWIRCPDGDLTTSDGVLNESVETVYCSAVGSVAYVPDGLVAAVDIYLIGNFKKP